MVFGLLPALYILIGEGHGWGNLKTTRPITHVWRAVTGLGAMGLFFYALPLMPLADAVAISFAKPLLITLLAVPLLGEKVNRIRLTATIIGFFGVLVIAHPTGEYKSWLGPALALASAFCFALSMITVRKLSETESTAYIVVFYTTVASIVSGLSLFQNWKTPDGVAFMLFLVLGLVGGTGQLLMTSAFRNSVAVVIAPFTYTAIIWALLFGYLIWGEGVSVTTLAGAALVIGSGLYLFREESQGDRSFN